MFAFFGALALAAVSAPSPARHPTPLKGSVQGLFSADDYPAEALDKNEQGAVGFLLKIDGAGAVTDCTIKTSSGSELLDRRTCEIIKRRARFSPARDRRGRGVPSTFTQRVVWRIEQDLPEPSDPWVSTVTMSYGAGGEALGCSVVLEGAKRLQEGASPETCTAAPMPEPVRRLGDIAQLVIRRSFALGPIAVPQFGGDDIVLGRAVLALQIDASGNIGSCSVVESDAAFRQEDACDLLAKGKTFTPRKNAKGEPVAFSAMMEFTNFLRRRAAPSAVTQ